MTLSRNDDNIFKSPISDNDTSQKNKKTFFKKCLTMFDRDVNIKKSPRAIDKRNETKKFRKKFKKCLTERDRHDKLIKSPKQGDEKFFEN